MRRSMLSFLLKLMKSFGFFFKWKVYYSAIDPCQVWNLTLKIRSKNRVFLGRGRWFTNTEIIPFRICNSVTSALDILCNYKTSSIMMEDNILVHLEQKKVSSWPQRPKTWPFLAFFCPKTCKNGWNRQQIAFTVAISSLLHDKTYRYD